MAQAALVTAGPYSWMQKRRERYGDVFSSHFPFFGRVVYVADPALVKEVFAGDPTVFHAGEANATVLGDALGEHSLLTLDEGRHLSQRKLLLPPFHGAAVKRLRRRDAPRPRHARSTLGRSTAPSHCGRACRRSRSR